MMVLMNTKLTVPDENVNHRGQMNRQVQATLTFFWFVPVELFEKSNLFGYGEFLTAVVTCAQAEPATVIGTPLAVVAVGARVLFVTSLHAYIVRCSSRAAQGHSSSIVACAVGKDILPRKVLQQVIGK
jgi:hypothetical protein